MSEHISNGDYLILLVRSWVFAQTIAMEHQLPDAVQAADRASQLGPYIDPTAHIANGGKLDQDLTVLRILNRARDELIAAFPAIATTPVTIKGGAEIRKEGQKPSERGQE